MIDCGSTTRLFAQMLAARELRLTVVTNCLPVARALGANPHCRTILCCGDYVARRRRRLRRRGGGFHPPVQGEQGVHRRRRRDPRRRDRCGLARLLDQARDDGARRTGRSCSSTARNSTWSSSSAFVALTDIDAMVSEARPPKRLAARLESAGCPRRGRGGMTPPLAMPAGFDFALSASPARRRSRAVARAHRRGMPRRRGARRSRALIGEARLTPDELAAAQALGLEARARRCASSARMRAASTR